MGACATKQDNDEEKDVDSYDVKCVVSSEEMRVDQLTLLTSTPRQQQEITQKTKVTDENVHRNRPHDFEDTDTSDQESIVTSCADQSDEDDTDLVDCLEEMQTLIDNGYIPSNTKINEWVEIALMISNNSYSNFKKDSSNITELRQLLDSFEDELAHLIGISSDLFNDDLSDSYNSDQESDDLSDSFNSDQETVQHGEGNFTQNRTEEHDDWMRNDEKRRNQQLDIRSEKIKDEKEIMHSAAGSKQLETIMSVMGYSKECIDYRVAACKERDSMLSNTHENMTRITAGSKAEGVACWLESDYDVMLVSTDILCVESESINTSDANHKTVLLVRSDACYPGYCLLDLKHLGETFPLVTENVFSTDTNGNTILGSEAFIDNAPGVSLQEDRILYPRSGPSYPVSDGPLRYDLVYALRCVCPSILNIWAKRPRFWPPKIIVKKVVRMGGFVVPVGFKGSAKQNLEWRICFTTGETEIVRNLNETLIQVFVLLKMIVKEILIPQNKEITSYVVKNLVMWIAEESPTKMFTPEMLLYWLRVALNKLRTAITNTELRSYMIPERNLLECCGLTDEQKITWEAIITELIKEGSKLLIRLSKFRRAIIAYPEPLLTYCKLKLLLEVLVIEDVKRRKALDPKNALPDTDIVLIEVNERIEKILEIIKSALLLEGWDIEYDEILVQMLS